MELTCSKKVVILGSGFGGLYTADYLAKRVNKDQSVEVSIIDRHNYFLYTPMLHAAATGSLEPRYIAFAIRKEFRHKNIYPHISNIHSIDTHKKLVQLDSGVISYDYLVISLGSQTNFYGMKNIEQKAFTLKDVKDAVIMNNHIINMFEKARWAEHAAEREKYLTFVIAGGGPTGVEVAGELHAYLHNELKKDYPRINAGEIKVYLLEASDRILPSIDLALAKEALRRLEELGVKVMLSSPIKDYNDYHEIDLGEKGKLASYTLIWAAGVKNSPVLENLPYEKDNIGRIIVNEYMQVPSDPNVFVVGDNANCIDKTSKKPYPPTAQIAVREAKVAAQNIYNVIYSKPLKPFTYKQIGGFVSIGDNYAILAANKFSLKGFIAWFIWNLVYIQKLPGRKNRLLVTLHLFLRVFFERNTAQLDIINDK